MEKLIFGGVVTLFPRYLTMYGVFLAAYLHIFLNRISSAKLFYKALLAICGESPTVESVSRSMPPTRYASGLWGAGAYFEPEAAQHAL